MSAPFPLRWRDVYRETELYKAAVRVYTKPLFQWRRALSTSTDGRNLYDMAARGLRGLDALHRALASQSFAFRPALALHYNFNGKHRTLYLAPWEDRIVDLLLYRVLNRRLHAWFSPHAYAYRDSTYGLDACQARIAGAVRAAHGPLYVVKRDIADCFASVNHPVLLRQLATLVAPGDYLDTLLDQRIRFSYSNGKAVRRADVGIPFGTAIACLLANIALSDVDREIESIPGIAYFRYADDLLLLARERHTTLEAAERLEHAIAALHLRCKPTHSIELVVSGRPIAGVHRIHVGEGDDTRTARPAATDRSVDRFTATTSFRHLGLLFRSDGAVALSRDKRRKLHNLFRFAFRRRERTWGKSTEPRERARALCTIAADTLTQGVRNVAIFDYYLKHVDDERQWRALDRWLAEEVLSRVFGGHKRGHFARLTFADLRGLGLPSLVHRRRLLRRGAIESAFFIWQRQRATRAFGRTVAKPASGDACTAKAGTQRRDPPAFSSFPQAAASRCL
jgi:hypothetical protein